MTTLTTDDPPVVADLPQPSPPPAPALRQAGLWERMEVLQRSEINARIWEMVRRTRELREDLVRLNESIPQNPDAATMILAAAGIAPPPQDAEYGQHTFEEVLVSLSEIADFIRDNLDMPLGSLPYPPAEVRAAA
jgi:hypothetical protein